MCEARLPWLPGCLEWEPDRTRRTLQVISAFVIVFATQPSKGHASDTDISRYALRAMAQSCGEERKETIKETITSYCFFYHLEPAQL
jgi:hypothetical protein